LAVTQERIVKKVLAVLLVLIVLTGVIFYFGWIQFLIPSDGYGVVFSKTHGWEMETVQRGEFEWRWQRLIPTNMDVYVFRIEPHEIQVSASDTLPSGEIYRTVLADEPDLSFDVSLRVSIAPDSSQLPVMASEDGLRPEDLEDWLEDRGQALRTVAVDRLVELLSDGENAGDISRSLIEEDLTEVLSEEFPDLRVSSLALNSYRVPDFELYQEARSLYFTQLEAETDALTAAAAERADRQARDEEIQLSLRSYGEVLDEYPVLLDYFELGVDPFQLQRLFESQ